MRAEYLVHFPLVCLAALCLTGCGAYVGSPAMFSITPARPEDRITTQVEGDTTLIEVYSESGIGKADVKIGAGALSSRITLRFHLKGLEELRFIYGQTVIKASISSRGENEIRQEVSGAIGQIDSSSPYWMAMSIVSADGTSNKIPLENGYIEVQAPQDFLSGGQHEFSIQWIDFYR